LDAATQLTLQQEHILVVRSNKVVHKKTDQIDWHSFFFFKCFATTHGLIKQSNTHTQLALQLFVCLHQEPSGWKRWRIEKLEKLVQNQSIGSIVGARPTAAPRNGRRDKVAGIMSLVSFFFFESTKLARQLHQERTQMEVQ